MKNTPVVIIPLYKKKLDAYEDISVRQCFKILANHRIVAIKPFNLDIDRYNFPFNEVISFDNDFFKNVPGYNRLMLSPVFYERFLDFRYILIYQPDVFVFKDALSYWCNSGYDYVGAPWLRYAPYPDPVNKFKNLIRNYLHYKGNIRQPGTDFPTRHQFENRVGNGGFSLRNTEKFHKICLEDQELITYYNSRDEYYFGEDVFWSLEANRKNHRLNIPDYKTALRFSIENSPEHAFKIIKGEMPFGCHAWDRNLEFWKPVLRKYDIII